MSRPLDEPSPLDGALVVSVQSPAPARLLDFERVYAAHYRDVYRYVLGLTRSTFDAEEIASDTFERAIRTWSEIPDRPIAWLLVTARRLATDRFRRARRLARILLASPPPARSETPTGHADFDTWFDSLARVVTDRQREVLVLRYERDLTDADIGVVMGLSESGVRSLVSRALAILRSHPELFR